MGLSETRHTSEANQRAPPENVMSAAVTSATCTRTIPHGNLTDICHSVQVRSDPKAKYNSQRYHDLLNTAFATYTWELLNSLMTKRNYYSFSEG